MSADDPGRRAYRRLLVALLLFMGLVVTAIGIRLLLSGHGFYAFLAICVLGFLVLVIHGYRQEERESAAGPPGSTKTRS